MRGSRKFCQRGSKFDNVIFICLFCLVDEGIDDANITKMGRHRPASETPFKWRFAGGPMNAGLVAL